jgi:hypothetical protein
MHGIVYADLRDREAAYCHTRDHKHRAEPHIPAKMCPPVKLLIHRGILRDINGRVSPGVPCGTTAGSGKV